MSTVLLIVESGLPACSGDTGAGSFPAFSYRTPARILVRSIKNLPVAECGKRIMPSR